MFQSFQRRRGSFRIAPARTLPNTLGSARLDSTEPFSGCEPRESRLVSCLAAAQRKRLLMVSSHDRAPPPFLLSFLSLFPLSRHSDFPAAGKRLFQSGLLERFHSKSPLSRADISATPCAEIWKLAIGIQCSDNES